jgi:hypothetical protein
MEDQIEREEKTDLSSKSTICDIDCNSPKSEPKSIVRCHEYTYLGSKTRRSGSSQSLNCSNLFKLEIPPKSQCAANNKIPQSSSVIYTSKNEIILNFKTNSTKQEDLPRNQTNNHALQSICDEINDVGQLFDNNQTGINLN